MKTPSAKNRLAEETSPYLLQHQHNPVDWYPWSDEALERARAEDKPILLSVGYSSCHWCHVMAHESFEDHATADLMNTYFINVKVDREERPDLDVIYQSALALMGQHGGWPLTMFLTPEGKPFWGGTYFPNAARFGRPGFKDVLQGLHDAWTTNRHQVTSNVEVLSEALNTLSHRHSGKALDMEMVDKVASGMLRAIDPIKGGFRGAPKFPQAPFLKLMWRAWRRNGSTLYYDAVVTTLERMCQGGIFDHLGGGFSRYSTDEDWLVPHFEKMLYDNALLVSLMSEVYRETASPLLRARVHETIDWVLREMVITHDGQDGLAFASALDADSEGEEGRFYVWNEDEIDAVLGESAPLFKQTYSVTASGNWDEGGPGINVLSRVKPYPGEPAMESHLEGLRVKLFEQRAKRPRPGLDDKVLADLNGLMIQALVDASTTFGEAAWLETAQAAFGFVSENLTVDGRLSRTWKNGRARHRAVLDDLAQMSRAALLLFEATGDGGYLAQAESWTAQADDLFWCDHDGGYCLSARDATDVITRSRLSADNALPNGNGTMADILARLYLLTGESGYRAKAQRLIESFPAETVDAIANMPTLLNAYELLAEGAQVVIAQGKASNGQAEALLDAALGAPAGLKVVMRAEGGVPPGHPAHGKTAPDGEAVAYVCRGGVCGEPVHDAASLLKALDGL